ncbi:MAG: hypothetical protein WAS21_00820 [Geminicoccaceae bacterium]
MSSQPIDMNDADAVASVDSANLYTWLIFAWLLAAGTWSIHRIAPEIFGFSPDFLLYGSPYTPSLPILTHAALALGGAITLLAVWAHLTGRNPRPLSLAFLLGAITTGIELDAAWLTISLRAIPFDIIADPLPDPAAIALDSIYNAATGVLAALVLVLTIWRGRKAITASRHDRISAMDELLCTYFLARFVLAVSLSLPVYYDERAAWSTVSINHGPPLTWLVAAALPLGLGLACLVNRFRPRPESLPPAPGS